MFNPIVFRRSLHRVVLVVSLASALGRPAGAQPPEDPATTARIRFGPLGLTPKLSVTNIGVDSNVFNTPTDPKKDFTASITPSTDVYVRIPRVRLDSKISSDLLYFRTYASQRGTNARYVLRVSAPLNRVRPFAEGEYANVRQRPGFEIDTRARYHQTRLALGTEVRFGGRTTFGLEGRRTDVSFNEDEFFRGTNLRDVLNRRESAARLSIKHALTPLTRLFGAVEVQRDRFSLVSARNADSTRVVGGVEFEPFALINGRAEFGYRRLQFLESPIPDSRGAVASVDLGYTLLGTTRFNARLQRDVQYSYDVSEAYYVLTGGSLTVTQHLVGRFDAQVTGGRQRLAYSASLDRGFEHVDRVTNYGGGGGYRLGNDARLGFLYERVRRASPLPGRSYDGYRAGSSITYGF